MSSREHVEQLTNRIYQSERKQGKQVSRESIREQVVRTAKRNDQKSQK
jgi:hypothetical protein